MAAAGADRCAGLANCLSFLGPARGAEAERKGARATLRILTANDIYKPERFAVLKSLARDFSGGPAVTKLVLPGDLLGGSLFATAHRGEAVIDVLNALQVDYCTLGNHEFDYGAERTRELMDKSRFPWLGSNVRAAAGEGAAAPIFHTTRDTDVFEVRGAREVGTVRVGVFGLCTPATPELSHPGPSVAFEAPVDHARRCVAALQEQGCELIIALTHLSLAQDKLVADACPGIRAILGGHDHDPFLLVHRGTLIAKCGQNADHMGVLDLHLGRDATGVLHSEHSFNLVATWKVPADPVVVGAIARWKGQDAQDDELCTIGDVPLSTKTQELRTQENAFACHVADAIRWSYREQGCEVAVQNGGFVRQDAIYPPRTTLTANEVREEMPFPKRPVLLRLSGRELRQGLEEMLANSPVPSGAFPQLSEGFRVVYRPNAPKFGKITRIEIGGEPLDLGREYLVAISEFYTMLGGDGVEAFAAGRVVSEHGEMIREVAVKYFRMKGIISGKLPGRLIAEP